MSGEKQSFSAFTHVYLIIVYSFVVAAPLLVALFIARHNPLPNESWIKAASASALLLCLFVVSKKYASTENLSYYEGLLYISAYCRTGWSYSTYFVLVPALAVTFFYVAFFSTLEAVSNKPGLSAARFHKLILFAYKHRAIQ